MLTSGTWQGESLCAAGHKSTTAGTLGGKEEGSEGGSEGGRRSGETQCLALVRCGGDSGCPSHEPRGLSLLVPFSLWQLRCRVELRTASVVEQRSEVCELS